MEAAMTRCVHWIPAFAGMTAQRQLGHSRERGNEVRTAQALRHQRHSRERGNEVRTAYACRHQRHSRERGNEVRTAYACRHQRHSRERGNPVDRHCVAGASARTHTQRFLHAPSRKRLILVAHIQPETPWIHIEQVPRSPRRSLRDCGVAAPPWPACNLRRNPEVSRPQAGRYTRRDIPVARTTLEAFTIRR